MELGKIMHEKRITARQISEKTKLSESYISLIRNGSRRPSVEVAKKIAGAVGIEWTRFFEDEGN